MAFTLPPPPPTINYKVTASSGTPTLAELRWMDVNTLLFEVHRARNQQLAKETQSQLTEVRRRNEEIKKVNELIDKLNQNIAWATTAWAGDRTDAGRTWLLQTIEVPPDKDSFRAQCQAAYDQLQTWGIDVAVCTNNVEDIWAATAGEKKVWVQALKARIDDLTSVQQMATSRLNTTSNKGNEITEMLTKFIAERHQTSVAPLKP